MDSFPPIRWLDASLSGCAVQKVPHCSLSPDHVGCSQPLTELMLIQNTTLNAAMGQDSGKGNGVKRQVCGPDLCAALSVREKKHIKAIFFFQINGTQFNVPQFKVFCHMILDSSVPKSVISLLDFLHLRFLLYLMFKSPASERNFRCGFYCICLYKRIISDVPIGPQDVLNR